MRAIAADLGPREHDLESEVRFHLPAHLLQRLAEKFLDFAAAQADDVRVLLLQASLVVMLVALEVHQIELVHQAAFFEQLQRAIDRDAIELGVFFLGQLIQALGVQVRPEWSIRSSRMRRWRVSRTPRSRSES